MSLGRLSRSTFVYGVGGALAQAITVALLPIYTRYLTPTEYGVTGILALLSFFVEPIFSFGFGTSIVICYFERRDRRWRASTIWTAVTTLAVSGVILCLAGWSFRHSISLTLLETADFGGEVAVCLFATCFLLIAMPPALYLQFEDRAERYVMIKGLIAIVSVVASVILIVVLRRGVMGWVEAMLVSQVFGCFLFLANGPRTTVRPRLAIAKSLLRFGLPMVPAFLSLLVLLQANRYFLERFEGLAAVGVYTVGFTLGSALAVAVGAFQKAWPAFFMRYKERPGEAHKLFGRVLTYYVIAFGTLNMLFFIAAKPAVMMLATAEFHDAYRVVGFAAMAYFMLGAYAIFLPAVYFAKQVGVSSLVQAVAAVVAIGLNFLIIPPHGVFGAGVTLALGLTVMVGLQYGWNYLKRRRYLVVEYEWKRLGIFAVLYLVVSIITLRDRQLSLLIEMGAALILTALVIGAGLSILNRSERATLSILAPSFLAQMRRLATRNARDGSSRPGD